MTLRIGFVGYNTAGCWTGLQLGFKQLGIDSDVFGESDHPFRYGNSVVRPPERVVRLSRVAEKARAMAATTGGLPRPVRTAFSRPLKLLRSTADALGRAAFLRYLGERYDIVFTEASSGIGSRPDDIDVLSSLNTKVVSVAFGSDMRPLFLNGAAYPADRPVNWDQMRRKNTGKLLRAHYLENSGATIIASPGTSHFFCRPFVDREMIGFPIVPVVRHSPAEPAHGSTIVILHAPSSPAAKGTTIIQEAVEEARRLGHDIAFRILSGVPRRIVADELARADIVIDQIYSDQYAGVLAREAASVGTHVLIGAHDAAWLAAAYRTRIPAGIRLVAPTDLLADLLQLCEDVTALRSCRTEVSDSFAATDSLGVVADKWLQVALGNVDDDWRFDPCGLDVTLAGFAAREHLVKLASGWVGRYGLADFESLGKEKLVAAVEAFVHGEQGLVGPSLL